MRLSSAFRQGGALPAALLKYHRAVAAKAQALTLIPSLRMFPARFD
jgi:hypothetical protein